VDPANRALATLLRETGIGPRVHLLGQRDDTPRLYAAMDVAALASYTEGFPNVLGEAMACGVPCVSTDVGAARSIIGDGGRIVPVRDPAAMASAWTALLAAGPDRLRAMGTAARDRIARDWTIQRVTAQYGELYARVRSGSARR
jgi:glycosyltransferase involved in cell wall biosynthesis